MTQTRMTKQRAIILEALRSVASHPTADDIYRMVRERLPRISLGTVYRNLELLTGAGEILRLDRAGAQKRFDGNAKPHAHVRCRVCGRIGDVSEAPDEPSIYSVLAEGFTVQEVAVEYIGTCHACAGESQREL
jgi:Fur family ferric uptake transcriptional regulator